MSLSSITDPGGGPRFVCAIALMMLAAPSPAASLRWLGTGTSGGTDRPAGTSVNIPGGDGEALRAARVEEHGGSFTP